MIARVRSPNGTNPMPVKSAPKNGATTRPSTMEDDDRGRRGHRGQAHVESRPVAVAQVEMQAQERAIETEAIGDCQEARDRQHERDDPEIGGIQGHRVDRQEEERPKAGQEGPEGVQDRAPREGTKAHRIAPRERGLTGCPPARRCEATARLTACPRWLTRSFCPSGSSAVVLAGGQLEDGVVAEPALAAGSVRHRSVHHAREELHRGLAIGGDGKREPADHPGAAVIGPVELGEQVAGAVREIRPSEPGGAGARAPAQGGDFDPGIVGEGDQTRRLQKAAALSRAFSA